MDIFHVGEIAIIRKGASFASRFDDTECTIEQPLQLYKAMRDGEVVEREGYVIRAYDGIRYVAGQHSLRKKRPPREDLQLVRWSQCPWQPHGVRV